MIEAAAHPVIIAGYGCIKAGARDLVSELSDHMGIPVATSLKGKGVVAEGSALSLGCLGVTSNGGARRYIVEHADLVVFLGAGFNERTSYLWDSDLLAGKRVAQVDRDPAQLGRVFRPDLAIQGDIRQVVIDLLEDLRCKGLPAKTAALPEQRGDDGVDSRLPPAGGRGDTQQSKFHLIEAFYSALARHFPHNAIIIDDNIVFAQSYFDVSDSNHYFPNSGISSLGHAIPAAIGARCHAADSPTFAILGDGGFQMCCMEIMTAVNYGIPLNVVVINNESNLDFNDSSEGGGASLPDVPSEFGLYTVLAIDMSDSIFNNGAEQDVINGAKVFVDKLVTQPEAKLKHNVALIGVGGRGNLRDVDFDPVHELEREAGIRE